MNIARKAFETYQKYLANKLAAQYFDYGIFRCHDKPSVKKLKDLMDNLDSLGLNIKKSRLVIIFATSILAGSITAFAGPIAFVGLAVPHLAKLLFQTSNHKILFFSTILIGAIIMLFCDMVSQMPGMDFTLPINAITSIVGAPVVIWLLLSKKRMI